MGAQDRDGGWAGAVALAAVILCTAGLLAVALVVAVLVDSGWSRVIWAVAGGFLLWQLVPRPARLSPRAVVVPVEEAPALHRLVAEVAAATGTRAPGEVVVDTVYATSMVPIGYLGRATLVVGLPQWTALDGDERLACVAHELACAEPARRPAGVLIRLADDLLTRMVVLLQPARIVQPTDQALRQADSGMGVLGGGDEMAGDRFRREVSSTVGAVGLSVIAAPVRGVRRALRRAGRQPGDQACLVADRRAATLVGAPAVVRMLLSTLGVPRGWVAAEVAARRRTDAFVAMAEAEPPAPEELARRLAAATATGERTDPHHASTASRVEALGRGDVVVTRGVGPAVVRAADRELDTYRERLARRFAEELVHGRS